MNLKVVAALILGLGILGILTLRASNQRAIQALPPIVAQPKATPTPELAPKTHTSKIPPVPAQLRKHIKTAPVPPPISESAQPAPKRAFAPALPPVDRRSLVGSQYIAPIPPSLSVPIDAPIRSAR